MRDVDFPFRPAQFSHLPIKASGPRPRTDSNPQPNSGFLLWCGWWGELGGGVARLASVSELMNCFGHGHVTRQFGSELAKTGERSDLMGWCPDCE